MSCEVQPKDAPSLTNVPQVGSHGLHRRLYNKTNLNWGSMESLGSSYYTDFLATSFEIPVNEDNKIGNKMKGWFIAPETTSYRFHVICDDLCDLYMGLNTSDPLSTTTIV